MKNFAIVEPFGLDWKYVMPHDYETLEYCVTPTVSVLFHKITNGKNPFHIGSFIMEDASRRAQFNNEIMPQRSQERIERAFKDEEISVFFALEDAKALDVLFKEEGFICRRLEVREHGRPVDILNLDEADFNKVVMLFGEWKVMATTDFDKQWENITEEAAEIREEIAKGMRQKQAARDEKAMGVTKKTLIQRSALATGLIALGTAAAAIGKAMFERKTKLTFVVGLVSSLVSVVAGNAGRKLTGEVLEHVGKGMIINYG